MTLGYAHPPTRLRVAFGPGRADDRLFAALTPEPDA
jgi:hypothetical protein